MSVMAQRNVMQMESCIYRSKKKVIESKQKKTHIIHTKCFESKEVRARRWKLKYPYSRCEHNEQTGKKDF